MDPRGETATVEPETEDQIGRALRDLAAGHPEFRFFRARCAGAGASGGLPSGSGGLDPGLHTVITADLGELREALSQDHGSAR
jgi:hypothetical protein